MQVLPQCGHAVHEDAPEKVSLCEICKLPGWGKLLVLCVSFTSMSSSFILIFSLLSQVADALATFMVRHKFTEFKEGYLW